MLQDSIDRLKKPEVLLTPEDRRQIREDIETVYSYASEEAAKKEYRLICDEIALQLSQGEKEVSGEFTYGKTFDISLSLSSSIIKSTHTQLLFDELAQRGLHLTYKSDNYSINQYSFYLEESSSSDDGRRTTTLTVGENWERFWDKLQALAREDGISLSACLRVRKNVSVYPDYKLNPQVFTSEQINESETPATSGTFELSWPSGIKRAFEKPMDFLCPRHISIFRYYMIVIKYHYSK